MFNPGEDTTPSPPAFQHRRPTRKATDFINLEIFIRRVTIFAKKKKKGAKGHPTDGEGREKGARNPFRKAGSCCHRPAGGGEARHARARIPKWMKGCGEENSQKTREYKGGDC